MTAFFRVQNRYGLGLYTTQTSQIHLQELSTNHPSPSNDSKLMEALGLDYFCQHPAYYEFRLGFTSIEQVLRWLYQRSWLFDLKTEGFALYEYDCPIFAGNTQAVAAKDTMGEPLRIHDLTTLF